MNLRSSHLIQLDDLLLLCTTFDEFEMHELDIGHINGHRTIF